MRYRMKHNTVFQAPSGLFDSYVDLYNGMDILHHIKKWSNTGVVNYREENQTLVFKRYKI